MADALALLVPGNSSATSLSTSPMAFHDTAAKAILQFNPTDMGALLGTHTFTMVTTMNDFPEMDSFTDITRTFDLLVTSACTTNEIIPPDPDFPDILQYVIESTFLIRENLEISDTGSADAQSRGYDWPANPFFCGKRTYTFEIVKFDWIEMSWTTDAWD